MLCYGLGEFFPYWDKRTPGSTPGGRRRGKNRSRGRKTRQAGQTRQAEQTGRTRQAKLWALHLSMVAPLLRCRAWLTTPEYASLAPNLSKLALPQRHQPITAKILDCLTPRGENRSLSAASRGDLSSLLKAADRPMNRIAHGRPFHRISFLNYVQSNRRRSGAVVPSPPSALRRAAYTEPKRTPNSQLLGTDLGGDASTVEAGHPTTPKLVEPRHEAAVEDPNVNVCSRGHLTTTVAWKTTRR